MIRFLEKDSVWRKKLLYSRLLNQRNPVGSLSKFFASRQNGGKGVSPLQRKEQILKRGKEWRNKNRGRVSIYSKKYYNNIIVNEPWIKNYKAAKSRCNGKNNNRYPRYGGRGIKFNLSLEDIKNLWLRDDASKMLKPSIDRIDNDGNYTFANCRFIELSENSSKKNT